MSTRRILFLIPVIVVSLFGCDRAPEAPPPPPPKPPEPAGLPVEAGDYRVCNVGYEGQPPPIGIQGGDRVEVGPIDLETNVNFRREQDVLQTVPMISCCDGLELAATQSFKDDPNSRYQIRIVDDTNRRPWPEGCRLDPAQGHRLIAIRFCALRAYDAATKAAYDKRTKGWACRLSGNPHNGDAHAER